ncbi:MAG: hypothetical protein KA978_31120 [Deltaproteobacteria bacterium]|nr:hypothetical protein [Deltaproteobacteria bacterium]
MPALLTLDDARAILETDRTDAELSAIIAREEAEVIRRYGAAGDGATARSETLLGGGVVLFLAKPLASVSGIQERPGIAHALQAVASTYYVAWPGEGRITRLGGVWGAQVVVSYVPVDERDRYRQALIDLVRLTIERRAMRAESVAGEHSYTAPEWERERAAILRRLRFMTF